MEEVEVFRISEFDPEKVYATALCTRKEGTWPNEKFFTTNKLVVVGKHVRKRRWGSHDASAGDDTFEYNGHNTVVTYDYDAKTCFLVISSNTITSIMATTPGSTCFISKEGDVV